MNSSMIKVTPKFTPMRKKTASVILNLSTRVRLSFNAVSFDACLSPRAVRFPNFTPFNYFNQISYHFDVDTLIMLLNEERTKKCFMGE